MGCGASSAAAVDGEKAAPVKRFGDATAVFIEIDDLKAALEQAPDSIRMIDVRQAPPPDRPKRPAVGVGGCPHASLPQDLTGEVGPLTGMHPIPEAAAFIETARSKFGIGLCEPSEEPAIVVFDGMGGAVAAGRLWWYLDTLGVPNVYILNGGFQAYKASGLPLTDAPAAGRFDATGDSVAAWPYKTEWWRVKAVTDVTELPALCDCRPAQGSLSTVRPCLPGNRYGGRIPNASPLPGNRNLVDMNKLRPWPVLQSTFTTKKETVGLDSFDGATFTCSAGVWCCFNAAIATHLGMGTPSIFFGSWTCYESNFPELVVERAKKLHGVAAVNVHRHNPKAWQIVGEELPDDDGALLPFSHRVLPEGCAVESTSQGRAAVRKLLRVMAEDEEIEAETADGVRFTIVTSPQPAGEEGVEDSSAP
jgi:thiosulfate/3-mercaptopyruvate sulfurtransferase